MTTQPWSKEACLDRRRIEILKLSAGLRERRVPLKETLWALFDVFAKDLFNASPDITPAEAVQLLDTAIPTLVYTVARDRGWLPMIKDRKNRADLSSIYKRHNTEEEVKRGCLLGRIDHWTANFGERERARVAAALSSSAVTDAALPAVTARPPADGSLIPQKGSDELCTADDRRNAIDTWCKKHEALKQDFDRTARVDRADRSKWTTLKLPETYDKSKRIRKVLVNDIPPSGQRALANR